jgi:hypothetical protein
MPQRILSVIAPKDPEHPPVFLHSNLEEKLRDPQKIWSYWTNPEEVFRRQVAAMEVTYYAGDALPVVHFNMGATGFAAFIEGAQYHFGDSLWFTPSILGETLGECALRLNESDPLFQAELEMAKYYAEHCEGRFLIGNPDNAGALDCLAMLRGPERLLLDMVDDGENVKRVIGDVEKIWETVLDRMLDILLPANGGYSCIGWLHTCAPGRHAQMQCDVSTMISPELFRKFCLPELVAQSEYVEHPLYHLDGMEQMRFLDMLLDIDRLEAIQWTCVAGQPSPIEFLPVLKRIQAAGKRLVMVVKQDEAETLIRMLSPQGLHLVVSAGSPKEADRLVEMASKT